MAKTVPLNDMTLSHLSSRHIIFIFYVATRQKGSAAARERGGDGCCCCGGGGRSGLGATATAPAVAAGSGEAQLRVPAAVPAVQAVTVAAVRLLFFLRRQCRLPLPELPPPARRPRLRQEGLPGQGLLHARRLVQVCSQSQN